MQDAAISKPVAAKRPLFALLAFLFSIVAIVRICLSYGVLSQTSDEIGHLATGMEWLDRGVYKIETLHPPLAKIAMALPPYLDGAKFPGLQGLNDNGNQILFGQGTYWRTLTLARIGILPFFIVGLYLVWSWTRKLYGEMIAMMAVAAYSLTPPILAHAGLATTDLPLATMVFAALYAWWLWLHEPTLGRSAVHFRDWFVTTRVAQLRSRRSDDMLRPA